jgi:hypothetical protein
MKYEYSMKKRFYSKFEGKKSESGNFVELDCKVTRRFEVKRIVSQSSE